MSIVIQKRIRTEITPVTDPKTYNTWGSWADTTEAAPYTNTDLVEYQTTDGVNFKSKYLSAYSELMVEAIKDGSPYKESINFMSTELDNLGVSASDKGTLTAQFMANVTTSITNNAMQIALTLADKDLKAENEVTMSDISKDIAVAGKDDKIEMIALQKYNLQATKDYTVEKKTQLINSVKFNNMTKSFEGFEGLYGQHKLGGGTITPSMWAVPYKIGKQLANSDLSTMTFQAVTTTD